MSLVFSGECPGLRVLSVGATCELEDHNLKMRLFSALVGDLALEPFGFVGEGRNLFEVWGSDFASRISGSGFSGTNLLLPPALERLSHVPEASHLCAQPKNLRLKTECSSIAVMRCYAASNGCVFQRPYRE